MRAHTSMIAAAAVVSLVAGSVRPAADAPSADRVVPADGVTAAAAVAAAATVEADEPAVRLSGPRPVSTCQQIAYVVGAATGASQVVAVVPSAATSTTAVVQLAALTSRGWECGPEFSGRIGRNGVRPLLQRRSGDGTTPAGVFPLGLMTAWDGERFSFFGNDADPGISAGPYRDVRSGDCFGATPYHPDYGHLVYRPAAECPGPDDEYLPRYGGTYAHAALIGANMEPAVSGDAPDEVPYAAAIFLHRHSYDASGASKPTSGCVSLRLPDLVSVLRSMRGGVVFAIGTAEWLIAGSW
ncbi:MAG: hypothetical protein ACKOAZ_06865 [Ilumatobacteraceae bacterium]